MGFLSSLVKMVTPAARAPRQPRQLSQRDVSTVVMSANSIVRVINESLAIAANTSNSKTKESRLGVVRKKLEMLAKLRAKYPFLTVDGMDAFRFDLAKVEQMSLPVKPEKKSPPKRRKKAPPKRG